MKNALRQLLERLDKLRAEHPELGEPEVGEVLSDALFHSFILRLPGYSLPESLGLVSPAGNAAVRIALADFLDATADCPGRTPVQRFAMFQDPTVETKAGRIYGDYFGFYASYEELVAARSRKRRSAPAPDKASAPWWQFWKRTPHAP